MITITIDDRGIMVSGHARAGPEGQDIVCSAISVLVQTLEESLRDLTSDNITGNISPGMAFIEYKDLSEQGRLLVESFFIGVKGVATAAPENVKVIREVNTVGASAIVAIYSAIKAITEVKKKAEQPMREVNEKLDRDKKRLDKLEGTMERLRQDNEMILTSLNVIINHLRTDNNTGAMQKLEEEIDSYLIKR